jgi:hypothetical protein
MLQRLRRGTGPSLAGVLVATLIITWLYLQVGCDIGSPAFWGIAAVLLVVAVLFGAQAWLATMTASAAFVYVWLVFSIPTLQWESQGAGIPLALQMEAPDDPGLATLHDEYRLDEVVAGYLATTSNYSDWCCGPTADLGTAAIISRRGRTR